MTAHVPRLPRLPSALDPLIGEAKRRARKRRSLAAIAVLLAALAGGLMLGLHWAGSGSHWVPRGVSEIDIRAPGRISGSRTHAAPMISRSITDPSQVGRIINWFDALKPPGKTNYGCAGGWGADVSFTFRSANGTELARAFAAPEGANPCSPIHLTTRGQQETFLVESNRPYGVNASMTLIGRIQRLIGTKFAPGVYYG